MRNKHMFRYIKKLLYPVTSRYWLQAKVIQGLLRRTNTSISILLIGNSQNAELLADLMFEDSRHIVRKFHILKPLLRMFIAKNRAIDLCITVMPQVVNTQSLQGMYNFKTTKNIEQIINTAESWEVIRNHFSHKTRQNSNNFENKTGLTYRITHSHEDFKNFYYDMYSTYISKKFDKYAAIKDYHELEEIFSKGGLLQVLKGNVPVAVGLFRKEGDVVRFHNQGVLDKSHVHFDKNAQFALYYFIIRYALENNLKAVCVGGSLPFLNDGVYRRKRAWGAFAVIPSVLGYWNENIFFSNIKPSYKVARVFENNPIIAISEHKLIGVLGMSNVDQAIDEKIEELMRQYQDDGIAEYTIITPDEIRYVSPLQDKTEKHAH